ncbi:MAG: hypothetical protein GY940_05155, partial [bacterium]|nr:hypothetical protein [bacterium]
VEEIREQEGEAWDSTKTMQLYAGLYGVVEEFLESRGMIHPVTHGQGEPSADPGDDHAGSNSSGYQIKPGFGTDTLT